MADYKKLIPFILQAEGGYVNNPNDKGGETNKGITWNTWQSVFGSGTASHSRFMIMNPEDWSVIFKKLFWDKCLADTINSQSVANMIADWVWGSGQYYPEKDIQQVINLVFKKHLSEDGIFGPATIEELNEEDENILYSAIIDRRKQYYRAIVAAAQAKGDHSQDGFLNGWENRVNNLINFNSTFLPKPLKGFER